MDLFNRNTFACHYSQQASVRLLELERQTVTYELNRPSLRGISTMDRIFLSHTGADKPVVRRTNAELVLLGAETHFDELSVLNGEIINEWIDRALAATTIFVLFWSADAEKAPWVKTEWTAAHWHFIEDPTQFLVVRLDDTELPPILQPKKWIDARSDTSTIAREILGLTSNAKLLMSVQNTLESWDIRVESYPGIGPIVGCGDCGADLDSIEVSTATDHARDDQYIQAKCTKCGWWVGGELPW
jgi:hypothetical protein